MLTEFEEILYNSANAVPVDALMPHRTDAWSTIFPDLKSLPKGHKTNRPLRFCIATEEIIGPVRNGGIGTTYTYLAEMLADLGLDVTVLYLRGNEVENADVDYWFDFYKAKGIAFVPVPNYAAIDHFRPAAQRWLHPAYNMLRYLLDNPMDVVHVSEWHGCGFLSLLAKRQGLILTHTLFVVKASSPWMWNRLYGSQPLERVDDLIKIHAERRSIELADIVIGGSRHLLRWMLSQGYQLPAANTYTQPNVANFEHLRPLMAKRSFPPGTRIPVDEIVFFGRLEARKGLFTFCRAIARLIRTGVTLPPNITFMGKPGGRFPFRPNQDVLDCIHEETANWPTKVTILSESQQYEALEYLLNGKRVAVMPSFIENSSLAVYEAAICGIPFIATSVGGTPELIEEEDHDKVLCEPHPVSLADKIAETLNLGGYIARASFDNEENLATWRSFHEELGRGLLERLLAPGQHDSTTPVEDPLFSVCVYYTGEVSALAATLKSLGEQLQPPQEILIAVDSDRTGAAQDIEDLIATCPVPCRVVEAHDLDAGAAFNLLAEDATGDFLLFLWEGATLRPHGLRALVTIARKSGADILNYFYRIIAKDDPDGAGYLKAVILGSVTDGFFQSEVSSLPLAVRADAFRRLKGFTSDYRVLGHDYEFVAKAQLAGFNCETALLDLGSVVAWDEEWLTRQCYDMSVGSFRAIRPLLASSPLALRDLLLLSKGLRFRADAKRSGNRLKEKAAKAAVPRWVPLGADRRSSGQSEKQPPIAEPLLKLLDDDFDEMKRRNVASRKPPSGETETVDARVLGIRAGVIYGWAVDKRATGKIFDIEVLQNGQVCNVIPADEILPVATRLSAAAEGHGFMIPAFASLLDRSLSGADKLISKAAIDSFGNLVKPQYRNLGLRMAGSGQIIAEDISVAAPWAKITKSAYQGYSDPSDNGMVHGWVWKPTAPLETVEVAIFVDGRFLARVSAGDHREDLEKHDIGTGHYGFALRLPRRFYEGRKHLIEIVVANEGLQLGHTPMEIVGQKMRWQRNSGRPG